MMKMIILEFRDSLFCLYGSFFFEKRCYHFWSYSGPSITVAYVFDPALGSSPGRTAADRWTRGTERGIFDFKD